MKREKIDLVSLLDEDQVHKKSKRTKRPTGCKDTRRDSGACGCYGSKNTAYEEITRCLACDAKKEFPSGVTASRQGAQGPYFDSAGLQDLLHAHSCLEWRKGSRVIARAQGVDLVIPTERRASPASCTGRTRAP